MKWFDSWFGAHQKMDRIARGHLSHVFEGRGYYFPSKWQILKFEGQNGPDGIKRKSPAKDEPWHYYDLADEDDRRLIDLIVHHFDELVMALRERNQAKASFEAAWLSHAIVDGLTPAHHFPYEQTLVELRGGQGIETRTSTKDKLIMPGDTMSEKVGNNWKMWGDKGLLSSHIAFEVGVAAIIMPLRLKRAMPAAADLVEFRQKGVEVMFKKRIYQIAALDMYGVFLKSGWTPKLAKQVRRELAPLIISTITLAWYGAIMDAQKPVTHRKSRKAA